MSKIKLPRGARDVVAGTTSAFREKHRREPSKEELLSHLKDRAENDLSGWHRKHAKIAHDLMKEDVAANNIGDGNIAKFDPVIRFGRKKRMSDMLRRWLQGR